jgi:LysM repeat protein
MADNGPMTRAIGSAERRAPKEVRPVEEPTRDRTPKVVSTPGATPTAPPSPEPPSTTRPDPQRVTDARVVHAHDPRKQQLESRTRATYRVREGDNLTRIAGAHDLSLEQLLRLNPSQRTTPNLIHPGEVLVVQRAETKPDAPRETDDVRVRAGDTLTAIARTRGADVPELLELNPQLRARPDAIDVGETVRVPKRSGEISTPEAGTHRPTPGERGTPTRERAPAVPRPAEHDIAPTPFVPADPRSDVVARIAKNDYVPHRGAVAPGSSEYYRVSPVEAKLGGRELIVSNVLESVKGDAHYQRLGQPWQTAVSTLAPRGGADAKSGHLDRVYRPGEGFRIYSEQMMKSAGMQVTTLLLPEDRTQPLTVQVTGNPTYQAPGGRDYGALMARQQLGAGPPLTRQLTAPAGQALVLDRYSQPRQQGVMRDLLSDVDVKANGARVVQIMAPREFFTDNLEYLSPAEQKGPQPLKNTVPYYDDSGKPLGNLEAGTAVTPVHEASAGVLKGTRQVEVDKGGLEVFGVRIFGHQEAQRAGRVELPDGRRVYVPLGKAKNLEDLSASELEAIARAHPLDPKSHHVASASLGREQAAVGLDGRSTSLRPLVTVGRPAGILPGHQLDQRVALDAGAIDSKAFAYNLTLNKSFGANQELAPMFTRTSTGSSDRNAGLYGMTVTQTSSLTNSSPKGRVVMVSMDSPEARWTGDARLTGDAAGFIGGIKPHQRTFAGPVEVIERDAQGQVLSRVIREVEVHNGQSRGLLAVRMPSGEAKSLEVRTLGQSMQYAGTVLRYRVVDEDAVTPEVEALLGRR